MSHQDRREPLPADYQFPTHGVDCDCPPCRNRFIRIGDWSMSVPPTTDDVAMLKAMVNAEMTRLESMRRTTQTAYGWGV